jgi:hypothetical protein
MTPKERANKLRYQIESAMQDADMRGHYNQAVKECALIAVNLRIEAYTTPPIGAIEWAEKKEQYWQEVKKEIEKI